MREAAEIYLQVGGRLGLDWLRARGRQVAVDSHWQLQAVSAIIDDLYGQQLALTIRVVKSAAKKAIKDQTAVDKWIADNPEVLTRNAQLFADLRTQPGMDLAMLAVANRRMRELIKT